jgi:hypothetical protein
VSKDQKKPKAFRFTLASLYLAAGLAVWFLVLTRMVPAMNSLVDQKVRGKPEKIGTWNAIVLGLSDWVCAHQTISLAVLVIIGMAGFVLPFVIRPARYLVWITAFAVFLLGVVLAGSGYWSMIGGAIREANDLTR